MHFFDPTVDWPPELQRQEIPDLLFVRSHKLIDVDFNFPSPSLAGRFSESAVWSEYASFDSDSIFVKILLFKPLSIESEDEDHVNAILEDIVNRNGDVEIAQYRKILSTNCLHTPKAPIFIGCRASYENDTDLTAVSPVGESTVRRVAFKLQSTRENQGLVWDPPPYLLLEEIEDQYLHPTSTTSAQSFSFSNGILLRLLGGSHERESSANSHWAINRIRVKKDEDSSKSKENTARTDLWKDVLGTFYFSPISP